MATGIAPGRHELDLVPGQPVLVRVLLPPGTGEPRVVLHGRGLEWDLDLVDDVTFGWRSAPPGGCGCGL